MKKINVYLNVGAAPSSLEIVDFPPRGVVYHTGIIPEDTIKYYGRIASLKRKFSQRILNTLGLPRMTYIKTDLGIIHSTRGILILNKIPWVIDVEHPASFVGLQHHMLNNRRIKSIIQKKLSSDFCKKVMPHCEASKKALSHSISTKGFEDKVETVYLAERSYKKKVNRKNKEKIILLFIGKGFFGKGGKEVLQSFDILKKKYDAELLMKSDVPENFRKKYPDVTYIDKKFNRDQLFENTYAKSDIFVFPSFMDTFGVVMMEAMSTGLPVITTDIFAAPEIVEDNKGGFLINSQLKWNNEHGLFKWKSWPYFIAKTQMNYPKNVEQIVKKASILIESSGLRKRMGKFNKERVEKGRFSIKERNKKYRRIYEEALKY